MPATAPERSEELVLHSVGRRSGEPGTAPSRCAGYPLALASPAARDCTRSRLYPEYTLQAQQVRSP